MLIPLSEDETMQEALTELLKVMSRVDSRLDHIENDLCQVKNDSKFKQLLIVLLLSSILGLNLAKSIAIKSIEGLVDESVPTMSPNQGG